MNILSLTVFDRIGRSKECSHIKGAEIAASDEGASHVYACYRNGQGDVVAESRFRPIGSNPDQAVSAVVSEARDNLDRVYAELRRFKQGTVTR